MWETASKFLLESSTSVRKCLMVKHGKFVIWRISSVSNFSYFLDETLMKYWEEVDTSWKGTNRMQFWIKIAKQHVIMSWCDVVWFLWECRLASSRFGKPLHMLLHSAGICNLPRMKITARSRCTKCYTFVHARSTRGCVWFHIPSRAANWPHLPGFMEGASKVQEIRAELHNCASILIAFCNAKERCAPGNDWTNKNNDLKSWVRQGKRKGTIRFG